MAPGEAEADRTWVIIAAYREESRVGDVVSELMSEFGKVVVVDDGSDDETALISRQAGAMVLRHVLNRGQGAALQTGIEFCLRRGAEVIVTFDADGQHRVEDAKSLVAQLAASGADVALGSRFLRPSSNIPVSRRMLLKMAVLFTRLTSGGRLTDTHNGLRAFRGSTAAKLNLTMDRMAHASQLIDQIHRLQAKVIEVPVTIRYTNYSLAKGQSGWAAFRVLADYILGRMFG